MQTTLIIIIIIITEVFNVSVRSDTDLQMKPLFTGNLTTFRRMLVVILKMRVIDKS